MNGQIDFKTSLQQRVALLKGTPSSVLQKVQDGLEFTEGARGLCSVLKKLGYKMAVISGGFMPLALYVKNTLGLDYAFANNVRKVLIANTQLEEDNGIFTGKTVGTIVDAQRKADLLEVISQTEGVSLDQV